MEWNRPVRITSALLFIVISMAVTSSLFLFFKKERQRVPDYEPIISSVIQTGTQREALPTAYLLELLDLSVDKPLFVKKLDCKQMARRLLSSPLISSAKVKLLKPGTLYIDYEIRKPIALLEDYPNVGIDKEGYLVPLTPFFSPKNLPAFYLGLAPFGKQVSNKPFANWKTPLTGPLIDLCFSLLASVSALEVCDQLTIKRIDVSSAFADSYGRREIVVTTEDLFVRHFSGQDIEYHQKRLLRLNPKHFPQALANYLVLRKQLLEEEQKQLSFQSQLPDKVIDFRLDQLAFVE